MEQWYEVKSIVMVHRIGVVQADMIVLVSCPICEQSKYFDLELTDEIFTWECTFCKSKIESTIAAKKACGRSE